MKTFKSGPMGLGMKIRLDTKGIHLIKPGVIGSKDNFTPYIMGRPISSSTSLVGITTIFFEENKIKGFSADQASEIEKLYWLGVNDNFEELIELIGVDGQEIDDTHECRMAIEKAKADWLQEKADIASKNATEALNAQAMAASAAASAARAYDRHQDAAHKAIFSALNNSTNPTTPPPVNLSVYVAVDGQQKGPFDIKGLSQLVKQGVLTLQSLVWKEGLTSWTPASELAELKALFNSPNLPPLPGSVPPAL